ncbi:MAG: DUF2779 domain-containing protein, partial [Nanoarchaeota archaeon]|nr:DUF2779 domain-containing protein [Nanoarchaeota archaeon]
MLLTKSKFLLGLQCPSYLWRAVHEKEKLPEPDEQTKHIMSQGTKVGIMAQDLYPEGVVVSSNNFTGNLEVTKKLVEENKVIFEGGFIAGDCYARADILVPNGKSWDIVEVKSGTSVKEENVYDVCFQKRVYENAGLKIVNSYIMHLNNEYVR